ncbi:hypothetical protein ACH414_20615 [Streptomyces sp. NPDC020422]|uniref:hypothetical protein n=1 Tax=Streptomyces sp. NPDC020422 TaxID=3365074 RepID=UPI00378F9840
MRSLPARPGDCAVRARRFAVAVLLVLAALLGAGAGGAAAQAAGAESRTLTAAADPAAEVHDLTESEATAPVRRARRPAPPRGVRTAAPAATPAPAPAPVPSPRDDAPRSAVMRC